MTWAEVMTAGLAEIQEDGKLEEIKAYLRVDGEDDDVMVLTCARAAYQYVMDAVGTVDESRQTCVMLLLALTQEFYDNRTLTESEQQLKLRQSYQFQSIILQLQIQKDLDDDEEGDADE